MTKVKTAAKHRMATRPITPLSDLTQTSEFGRVALRRAVGVTAAGVVAGASFASSAMAVPTTATPEAKPAEPTLDEFTASLEQDSTGIIVSIDQTWDPGDEVGAEANEPAPVVVEEEPAQEYTTGDVVASRSESRSSVEAETVPVASVDTSSIAAAALSVTGIPYSYGGSSLSGMDCSGLVKYVYAQFGISLPHSSGGIGGSGTTIPMSEMVPGDIVAYPGHVAIYIGNGQMVEAVDYGYLSRVSDVRGGGWGVRI